MVESDYLYEPGTDKEYPHIRKVRWTHKGSWQEEGALGVGKTFAAKRLAYSMMGVKDPNRVKMVQFHQSYSYEDFIMGFRSSEKGFELKCGAFYNFCKEAELKSTPHEGNRMDAGKMLFGKIISVEMQGTWVKIEIGIWLHE